MGCNMLCGQCRVDMLRNSFELFCLRSRLLLGQLTKDYAIKLCTNIERFTAPKGEIAQDVSQNLQRFTTPKGKTGDLLCIKEKKRLFPHLVHARPASTQLSCALAWQASIH